MRRYPGHRAVSRSSALAVLQTLTSSVPHLRLAGTSAGLHTLTYLPGNGPTEQQLQARAARHSIALRTLAALRALTQLMAGQFPD